MHFFTLISKTPPRNLVFAIALLFTLMPLSAATWYVAPVPAGAGDASSPADPDTINNVLTVYPLAAGDSIEMAAGIYPIGGGTLIVNVPVYIYGAGVGATVVMNGNPTFLFTPASSGSTMSDLAISQSFGDGIVTNNAQVDIKRLEVSQSAGNGITMNGAGSTGALDKVSLINNQNGLFSNNSGLPYVGKCWFEANTSWGIFFTQNGVTQIEFCEFKNNGVAMEIQGGGNMVHTRESLFSNNGSGVMINNPGFPGNNAFTKNTFEFTANVAISIYAANDQTTIDSNYFFRDGIAVYLGNGANTKVFNNIIRESASTAIYGVKPGAAGIYFNTIAWAFEGIHIRGFNACQVDNNIVYQCMATGIWADGAALNANCNDSWGNAPDYAGPLVGGGNISVDPIFTFGLPFFKLASTSPLHGKACNTWVAYDHYGNPRDPFPNTEPGAIEN